MFPWPHPTQETEPPGIPGGVQTIYDVRGRLVRRLVEGEMPAGFHTRPWDSLDRSGRAVPAGVYFSRLEAGPVRRTRKIVLLH